VLSIAGLDPGGGAGIVADVKAIEAHGCWAAAVVTTSTVQTISRVGAVHELPAQLLTAQIDAVFQDHAVAAVKIGLLGSAATIGAVARALSGCRVPIVLDPVCASSSGTRFLDQPALACLRTDLLPQVEVLTPNQEEALVLAGVPASSGEREAVDVLLGHGARHVLVTGGVPRNGVCEDRLYSAANVHRFEHRAIATERLHGTGCLHSSSLAARLARGESILEAACGAGLWLEHAIEQGVAFGAGGSPDAAMIERVP
jgi:hydroxymethylpyrimidine/phosphomethylpyrimidine kinase